MEESCIFGGKPETGDGEQDFHGFKLLKTTANSSLYLAFKAGKRFLIKTTKDNSTLTSFFIPLYRQQLTYDKIRFHSKLFFLRKEGFCQIFLLYLRKYFDLHASVCSSR